jgi:ATP-binding cassette subfamily B protein
VLIERALDRLLRGRSSIIIAHRLATVRRADRILVIEHGRIVQQGTERELLAVDGSFRRLARRMHPPSAAIRGRPSERPAGRRRSPAET